MQLSCRKSTWNLDKPAECKIEIDPLVDLDMEIGDDESSNLVPKIVNVMSLKETVKREAPCDSTSLTSKKIKPSDDSIAATTGQTQPEPFIQEKPGPVKLTIKDDFNYKKGPEIAGITPYFPNVSQYVFLQRFGNATEHFLYVVNDIDTWGISNGTLITFQKAALIELMNQPGAPNVLAKRGRSITNRGPWFDQVRRLAQALFTKGNLLTVQNLEKLVKNQIIAIDNTKSDEHKISIDDFVSVKAAQKSTDNAGHFTVNLNEKGNN